VDGIDLSEAAGDDRGDFLRKERVFFSEEKVTAQLEAIPNKESINHEVAKARS
jgi:hypothetical protein